MHSTSPYLFMKIRGNDHDAVIMAGARGAGAPAAPGPPLLVGQVGVQVRAERAELLPVTTMPQVVEPPALMAPL
jgi:hypothetical protein